MELLCVRYPKSQFTIISHHMAHIYINIYVTRGVCLSRMVMATLSPHNRNKHSARTLMVSVPQMFFTAKLPKVPRAKEVSPGLFCIVSANERFFIIQLS